MEYWNIDYKHSVHLLLAFYYQEAVQWVWSCRSMPWALLEVCPLKVSVFADRERDLCFPMS